MEEINKNEAFDVPIEEELREEEKEAHYPPPGGPEPPKLKITLGEALTLIVDQVFAAHLPPGFIPPASPQHDLFRQLAANVVDEARLIEGLSFPEDMPWSKRALIVLAALAVYAGMQWYRVRQVQKFYQEILAAKHFRVVESSSGGQGGDQGTPGGGGAAQSGSTPPGG
jgi:uncharacterized membrane protein YgcG